MKFSFCRQSAHRAVPFLLCAPLLFAEPTLAAAQNLPPGQPVLAPDPVAAFKPGSGKSQFAELTRVPAAGQPFKQAIRAETRQRPPRSYDVQVRFPSTTAVQKGDTMLLRFSARAVKSRAETGEAEIGVVFERGREPYTKSLEATLSVGPDWKTIDLPFSAVENLAAGQGHVSFRFGFDPQIVEVGGIGMLNFGGKVPLASLPFTRFGYRGQELNAPWRKTAAARIEQHRKGDLTVRVTDKQGRPVNGAAVSVKMQRHAFGFGSAVGANLIAGPETEDSRKYRETILRLYNRVVFENDLKWPQWENPANRELTLQATRWLRERNIEIRGHCLIWPGWRRMPKDVESLKNDPAALHQRAHDHILEETTAMRGLLVDWDVINEPYTNHDVMDILGDQVMVEWFKLARQADPKVKLYLNDYSILSAGGKDRPHQDHFEKTLRYLISEGAPLDGIGMQGHFGQNLTPPDRLIEILDRFAALGKEIQVTEHDIDITDEPLQADYTRDFMTALFSHPSVVGILSWGFWEGRHWKPNGAYFRKDWSVKPAGQVWIDLVRTQWWTNAQGTTAAAGEYRTRGFLGDYEVTVTHAGQSKTLKATLPRNGHSVTVKLE